MDHEPSHSSPIAIERANQQRVIIALRLLGVETVSLEYLLTGEHRLSTDLNHPNIAKLTILPEHVSTSAVAGCLIEATSSERLVSDKPDDGVTSRAVICCLAEALGRILRQMLNRDPGSLRGDGEPVCEALFFDISANTCARIGLTGQDAERVSEAAIARRDGPLCAYG